MVRKRKRTIIQPCDPRSGGVQGWRIINPGQPGLPSEFIVRLKTKIRESIRPGTKL